MNTNGEREWERLFVGDRNKLFLFLQFFPIPWKKYKFLQNQWLRVKSYISEKLCVNPTNEKILNLTETSILGNLTNFY
jgi:hypothetical protein